MKNHNEYPYWNFKTKRDWLKNVRKRWVNFRNYFKKNDINSGCAFYPNEVYEWLNEFYEIDEKMKKYYKNA